ncbi:hypothetical protein SPURM210S_00427 [Streptomyces purpurascens]
MITGLAALTLHGFSSTPPLPALDAIDVLVPRMRRLRSTGCARIVRGVALPAPEQVTGLPVAPVARALADAVAGLADAAVVRRLMTEAVRGAYCEPAAVVRELNQARLLSRPHVVDAVDSLLAEGRAIAEDRLYRMVREYGLPDPVWNVDLRLPAAPTSAAWTRTGRTRRWRWSWTPGRPGRTTRRSGRSTPASASTWSGSASRSSTSRPGSSATRVGQQATVVRTALMAAADREPAAYVVVLPR